MTQLAEPSQPEVLQTEECCNLTTLSDEDMVIRGIHERPLYFIGYIRLTRINHIQIDQRSSLSIMPYKVLQCLNIPS